MKMIHLTPSELWRYFKTNALALESKPTVCATSGSREIWMTNDDGIMVLAVFEDDIEIFDLEIYDPDDVDEQYVRALMEIGFSEDEIIESDPSHGSDDDGETDDTELQARINAREAELDTIVENMVYDILGDDSADVVSADIEKSVSVLKEIICDVLTKKYDMPLYRPMYLVSEDGSKFFEEYPYPSMVSD